MVRLNYMKSKFYYLKDKAVILRKKGMTYGQIVKTLGVVVPKSTLSTWFDNITLNKKQEIQIRENILNNITKGQKIALLVKKEKRDKYLKSIDERIKHLSNILKNDDVAKVALAMLYLGEGSKTNRSSLMFGNSDPGIISLFLRLLRCCYNIDERKFRCTLQGRADQDIQELEKFWSEVTKIPRNQFYKARIDSRTIGKISKNKEYKGVCRIDYFSAEIFIELMKVIELIKK